MIHDRFNQHLQRFNRQAVKIQRWNLTHKIFVIKNKLRLSDECQFTQIFPEFEPVSVIADAARLVYAGPRAESDDTLHQAQILSPVTSHTWAELGLSKQNKMPNECDHVWINQSIQKTLQSIH